MNEFTFKESFSSAKEIVEQDSSFYMTISNVDTLFTKIPLEETIYICIESIYNQSYIVEGLKKSEFKELATNESYFIFNEFFNKQLDCVAMGSPLGPTLANTFLFFDEKKWLQQCPEEFKPVYYRKYVDDNFVLFKSSDHLIKFRDYLSKSHPNMKISFEEKKKWKVIFSRSCLQNEKIFVTIVSRKPTFSGVYMHFDSFLSTIYKFGIFCTLTFRCFSIYSNWANFHN